MTMPALPPLSIEDFSEAFADIHGHRPYLWQTQLLQTVVTEGRWPDTIAAPTGAGKTAVLDIALFHLALQAGRPDRTAPLRIVLAVDRRVIVDQAYDRARIIRESLLCAGGQTTALGRMADRLASLTGDEPLHVAELRGGIPLEKDWAKRPDQPTILCTTVDQLGSRLLFRGYGVSSSMAPIHAGLLGVDALLILDEAHLSGAFADTLQGITKRRDGTHQYSLSHLPWCWTALTATPKPGAKNVFELSDDERSEAAISLRLTAAKPAQLLDIKTDDPEKLAQAFFTEATAMMRDLIQAGDAAPVVAIVVNRVALARAVFDLVRLDAANITDSVSHDAILLTGRVRPADRDALIEHYRKRLENKRTTDAYAGASPEAIESPLTASSPAETPLFVVATQCIEAGADFDFDGMVTQIAPLDALRQRFGRLARAGNHNGRPTPGVILADKASIGAKANDPIYGDRMRLTWDWLKANAGPGEPKSRPVIDFGPDALARTIKAENADAKPNAGDCATQALRAPLLRQVDLDFLAMTSPRPVPDPDPSLFLYGEFRALNDVSIVWRGDLEAPFAEARAANATRALQDIAAQMASIVEFLPPRASEALALPVWRVKAWLARAKPGIDQPDTVALDTLADVDGRAPVADAAKDGRRVLRWRGITGDTPVLIAPEDIKPGDLIIVPASDGGCDRFGWAPESTEPVEDIAESAARPYEGAQAALRLKETLWDGQKRFGVPWTQIADAIEQAESPTFLAQSLSRLTHKLKRWEKPSFPTWHEPYGGDEGSGLILTARRGLGGTIDTAEPATEDDLGSFGRNSTSLDAHERSVVRYAEMHAQRLGLSPQLTASLVTAARWHDEGKADTRFQAFLRACGHLPDDDGRLLAKSGRQSTSKEAAHARRTACLPQRWRHEVLSVRLAATHLEGTSQDGPEVDPDLVLWLIGTHHGYGRPFFPHDGSADADDAALRGCVISANPGPDMLGFDWKGMDWSGLMAMLQQRYGLWGLAFLEACLRLSDHRASADGDA